MSAATALTFAPDETRKRPTVISAKMPFGVRENEIGRGGGMRKSSFLFLEGDFEEFRFPTPPFPPMLYRHFVRMVAKMRAVKKEEEIFLNSSKNFC